MKIRYALSPYLSALMLAAIICATSPFVAALRDNLFSTFPDRATDILAGGFLLTAFATLSWAWRSARHHPIWSGMFFILLIVLLWLQTVRFRTGFVSVDIVERIHILEYGALAFLLCRAFAVKSEKLSPSELGATLLLVTIAGSVEEYVQFLVETRTGEIRDVALDGFAGVCGVLFWLVISSPDRVCWRLARPRMLIRTSAATIAVVGLFFSAAHIGHEIVDPEIGSFVSWLSLEELEAAREDRARRWREDSPTALSPWRFEDSYLTEGGSHALHRNASYEAGHFGLARRENQILEKYFGPYIDLDGFLDSGVRRYPDWISAKLERDGSHLSPARYRSPVLQHRIYTEVSSTSFVFAVLMAAGVLWAGSFLRPPSRS